MASFWDTPSLLERLRSRAGHDALARRNLLARLQVIDDLRAAAITQDAAAAELWRRRWAWEEEARNKAIGVAGGVGQVGVGLVAVALLWFGLKAPLESAVLLAFVAALAAPILHQQRRLLRLRQTLFEGRCPDCRYPLADGPQGAPSAGPERCPECGGQWPLLPPAIKGTAKAPATRDGRR